MINRFLALQEEEPEYYTDEVIKGHVLVSQIKDLAIRDKTETYVLNFLSTPLFSPVIFLVKESPVAFV